MLRFEDFKISTIVRAIVDWVTGLLCPKARCAQTSAERREMRFKSFKAGMVVRSLNTCSAGDRPEFGALGIVIGLDPRCHSGCSDTVRIYYPSIVDTTWGGVDVVIFDCLGNLVSEDVEIVTDEEDIAMLKLAVGSLSDLAGSP